MTNKITTVLDLDDKGFKGGLKSIGSSVGEADGLFGKFKAGATAIMDVVKENAGAFAVAGGAALVGFAVKAVGAFTDTAKAAIDLGAATGLSTEQASRWIGVGDDYQVSAEALTASLGKVGKTLDSVKWDNYGIATRDAGGNARATNDILLDTFDKLGKITNETERARVGNDLFGKGYANIAPLIGKSRAEYEKMLGAVEKGQVITAAEAQKAEKFRLAQDQLGDALKEVTLTVGQQVASLAPLIVMMAKLAGKALELTEALGGGNDNPFTGIGEAMDKLRPQIEASGHDLNWWSMQVANGDMTLEAATKTLNDGFTSAQTTTRGYSYALKDVASAATEAEQSVRNSQNAVDGYSYAAKDAKDTVAGLAARNKSMTDDLERGLDRDKAAMDRLLGVVNDKESWLNLQNNFASTAALFDDKGNVIVKKGQDAAQAMRDAALAVEGLKKDVINYGAEVLGLPVERITKIVAAVDPQSLADVDALLAVLTRNRDVLLSIVAKGGAGYGPIKGAKASGGPVSAGAYLVGEQGPEIVQMGGDGNVIPAGQTAAMLGGGGPITVHINMPVGTNGDDVVRAIKRWEQRNGPGWRS